MFTQLTPTKRRRWDLSLLMSFAAHVVVVLILLHRPAPVFVMPSDVDLGTPGSSGSVIYLAPIGPERATTAPAKSHDELSTAVEIPPSTPTPVATTPENENAVETAPLDATARGGSPYGARIPGAPLTGNEVMPALPQVFPDPVVTRADVPPGVQGDVIVEVTIDEQGNVVETKLIQGIGYGIEDRVLATLRQWHFRPASRDGVAIASQHIVSFHYPG